MLEFYLKIIELFDYNFSILNILGIKCAGISKFSNDFLSLAPSLIILLVWSKEFVLRSNKCYGIVKQNDAINSSISLNKFRSNELWKLQVPSKKGKLQKSISNRYYVKKLKFSSIVLGVIGKIIKKRIKWAQEHLFCLKIDFSNQF